MKRRLKETWQHIYVLALFLGGGVAFAVLTIVLGGCLGWM